VNVTTKIGVLVASALAISLLVQVFYLFPEIRSREFGLQRVRNQAAADSIASEVRELQDSIRYGLERLAGMPMIRSMDANQQEAVLSIATGAWPGFATVSVGVADVHGTVTCLKSRGRAAVAAEGGAAGVDISERDYFRRCVSTSEVYYSDPFQDDVAGLTVAAISAPIRGDDGTTIGVIFAEIPLETMTGVIESYPLDEFEGVYMVDREGVVIAHSAKDLTELHGGPLSMDYSEYSVVQDLAGGRSGVREYEYDGKTYLASYMVVGASGWGIVFQEPLDIIMAKSNILPNFIFGISAAMFVTGVLVALVFARQIANPIRKLVEYARKVERGDYKAGLEVRGRDEIADVSSAIKSMVQQMVSMQEKELAAIVNSMKDGLITLDGKRRITRLNHSMEQMLGVKTADVLNKSPSELESDPRLLPLARLVQTESPEEEVVLTEPYERVVKVHSSELRGGEDKGVGEVKVVLDVTKEAELDQMKSDFIANTSHELRTPLHSIRGFVRLMLDGKVRDAETQREFLGIIDEQSQHLSNLVSGILDTAAMGTGEMIFERQPVTMNEVIEKAVVKLRNMAEDKEVAIEADAPRTLPTIEGDPEKLEQVVTNLVHNAIKFSQKGGKVVVTASAENRSLVVQVIDQGSGIPAGAIPLVFQKFYKVHGSMPWGGGGTGLGLYIVKQIVEAHGGQIWVKSKRGEGSTFGFRLPLSDDHENQEEGG